MRGLTPDERAYLQLEPLSKILTDDEVATARALQAVGRVNVLIEQGACCLRKTDLGALAIRVCPVGEP